MDVIQSAEQLLDRDFQFVTPINLSPTSQAGLDIVGSILVPFCGQEILVPQSGSGSDHAHIADKNVPNLRQLSLVARRKCYQLLFNVFIDQFPGLLILPSLRIPIPLFTENIFMMKVFHDVQIQRLKYPAGHIE